jgi:CreA protein
MPQEYLKRHPAAARICAIAAQRYLLLASAAIARRCRRLHNGCRFDAPARCRASSRKEKDMKFQRIAALMALLASAAGSHAEQIGEVDTAFRILGKDDRVVVEAYDDPKVQGVTCFVSRARTGGVSGTIGLAEDTSDASIACRQVSDNITFSGPLPRQESVFSTRTSILFKRMHIVRIVDPKRNALVYLTYSDKLIEGSPKNSVTAVAVPRSTPIPLRQ